MTKKKILTFILIVALIGVVVYVVKQSITPEEVIEVDPFVEESVCNFGEMIVEYDDMCGKEIGRSVEDRPIYVFKVGDGPKEFLFVGGLHTGQELNTIDLAERVLAYYLEQPSLLSENVSLYIVPVLNPDGVANETHTNARDINLNRNWGTSDWKADVYHPTSGTVIGGGGTAPYSEPETKTLYDFVVDLNPELAVVWHSKAATVEDDDIGIADELGALYAKAAGYEHIDEWTYYEVTGDFVSAMKEEGIPAMEVELETRETELERNLKGIKAVFDYFSE